MKRLLRSLFVTPVYGLIEAITPDSLRKGGNPIVPPRSVAGRSLVAVIAIMSFLASLTTGAVYLINQSANAWFQNIASEVTVQVRPLEGSDIDKRVSEVTFFLARQSGFANVRPISLAETGALLEPWLGKGVTALGSLPVPRLISIEIDRQNPPDLQAISRELQRRFKGVTLDDHGHWQAQIRTVTNSLALGGIAVLILVAIATIAMIISAARSALSSNRDIVEVLNFVGANHSFIVQEFERHFLVLGIRAGFLGAFAAGLVFLIMPTVMRLLGGTTVTATELRRMVGTATLDLTGYALLMGVVLGVAAICMLTSHYWVDHILNFEARKARRSNSGVGMFGRMGIDTNRRYAATPVAPGRPPEGGKVLIDMGRWVKAGIKTGIAALAVVTLGFFVFAVSIENRPPSDLPRANGIVVLTGGGQRISAAIDLLAKGRAERLLITGVHPTTSRRLLSRLMPANERLFACCIDIDRQALNTIGNAVEARNWAQKRGFRSLIIVTSGYHMPRALIELKRTMPNTVLYAYPVVSKRFTGKLWWLKPQNLVLVGSEYLKFLPAVIRFGGTRLYAIAERLINTPQSSVSR